MRDVIVIGAGGGGAVAAKELAARGLDVLVLEAGRYDSDDQDWSHYENDCNNPADGKWRAPDSLGYNEHIGAVAAIVSQHLEEALTAPVRPGVDRPRRRPRVRDQGHLAGR